MREASGHTGHAGREVSGRRGAPSSRRQEQGWAWARRAGAAMEAQCCTCVGGT